MGTVTLDYGMNSATANIQGNGVVGASINVTGTTNFGTVIATRNQNRTFTVTNTSPTEDTGTLSYSLTGATQYTILGSGTCPASGTDVLAGGASCTIVVRFSPNNTDSTTATYNGTLIVQQGAQTDNTSLTGMVSSQITLTPGDGHVHDW